MKPPLPPEEAGAPSGPERDGADAAAAADAASVDWTSGGDRLVVQRCAGCGHAWYFARRFCPQCGRADPVSSPSGGRGIVHATTLVHRAPDDAFRALAPYRIVLVDLDDGVRVMGHGAPALAIGDRVRGTVRTLAGRALPCFDPENPKR